MNIGILGLRGAGGTTLFSSFISQAPSDKSSFPSTGMVNVPDLRLELLNGVYNPKKTTHATVRFEDCIPMNTTVKKDRVALLEKLKVLDSYVLVVGAYRCMSSREIIDEFNQLRFELIIHDMDFITRRTEKLEGEIKKIVKDREVKKKEMDLLKRLLPPLENEGFLQKVEVDELERSFINNANFLTVRPVCYVLNFSEETSENEKEKTVVEINRVLKEKGEKSKVLAVNAPLEAEISMMDEDDRESFLEEYGIQEMGRDKVIKAAYEAMDLVTFFTVGEDECRAWELKRGSTALDAAKAIHTDLARGFIRAEVIGCRTLLELKCLNKAKKTGQLRIEGRTYTVQDGEIVHVMFNV